MAKPKCVPIEVKCRLRDGCFASVDGIVMLDAILYHAWFIKHDPAVLTGEKEFTQPDKGYIGLPLRHLDGNRYAASRAVYETTESKIVYVNKRFDFLSGDKLDYLDADKGVISDSVGKHKACRVPLLLRTVKDGILTFYGIGHADEVRELLSLMDSIGKKPAAGLGAVRVWEVREIDDDYTTYHPEYGLMRPIPCDEAEQTPSDCAKMLYGIRPPYWKNKNARMCYVPVVR